jgi:hypothetical protein
MGGAKRQCLPDANAGFGEQVHEAVGVFSYLSGCADTWQRTQVQQDACTPAIDPVDMRLGGCAAVYGHQINSPGA